MRGRGLLFLSLISAGWVLGACGSKQASPPTLNEPALSGTIAYQGTFAGQNGKSVGGTALIYEVDGQYVIRLENLDAPNETGLKVVGRIDGADNYASTLKSSQGSQNYSTGISSLPARTWNSVIIRSTINTSTPDYGIALLR